MDAGDWRSQLQADSRQRIVNKIMDTLKRQLPFSGPDGLQELRKIAGRFEEKIYTAATSQSDYLRKISLKMLTMETKSQAPVGNPIQGNAPSNNQNGPDTGTSMPSQVNGQGQQLPMQMVTNQSQTHQQLLSQNVQNNITQTGMQGSSSLTASLPSVSGLNQTTMMVSQNSNLPNIPGASQNSLENQMGPTGAPNMFASSQRQMQQVRQQQIVPQQPQQQPQNSQHYLYQQPQQNQLIKQKLQGNISHILMQSHIQQQQQQQPQAQQQSSQQSVMQPSVMQSAPHSGLQHNQHSTQSVLQQQPQAVRQPQQPQQTTSLHQHQPSLRQQQLMSQKPNAINMQQNQLIGQQNSIPDMHQQRLLGQDNNLPNLQQQHLIGQQTSHSNMHQQQLGPQGSVAGLQQQQQKLLGTQPGSSSMQANQHSLHMLQPSKIPVQQQNQQNGTALLAAHGQQSQAQLSQQQLISQIQSQSGQMQQQLGLQQPNLLQRDMQQRLQTSGPLLQQQNAIDQQKQFFQSQRAISEASSTSLDSSAQTGNANGGDWQEETYQKIKAMKELYLSELSEMHQKVATKLQQHDSLPHQPKNEQVEKLKTYKIMLERLITFLQVTKSGIQPSLKDKLAYYEKQVVSFLNSTRLRKPVPSLQQGHLPPHMHSLQQSQQPQSQVSQRQPHENQVNPQMQPMNLQGPVETMPSNMTSLQHSALPSGSMVSNAQQNNVTSFQPNNNMNPGQSNALNTIQQVPAGSLQKNPMSGPQHVNMNSLSSQSGVNTPQASLNPLQSNSNMLQHQHLKQQEQHMLQTQQLNQQFQQRQMQQQLIHNQQLMQQQQQQPQPQQQQAQQQLQQQPKQQQTAQFPTLQLAQLHQKADVNDLKIRQQMSVKQGVFQQHHSVGQRSVYHHQQLMSGSPFPISSPQLLQAQSPQIPQHPSPQIDQPNQLHTKGETPLQSASSPFVVPPPSTPLAPSPMPGESEKINSGISTLFNAANVGPSQTTGAQAPGQSLAIGTPGISASPLLAEVSSPNGNHGTASALLSGKSGVTEQPLERLIKVVKSMSPKALSASVSDISSVVSMIDRIAGSAPGNRSRAAVGEDLVAMTKCRLQARNFITQDATSGSKRMRRFTTAMPLNVFSSSSCVNDSFKQLTGLEASDLESTATSIKKPRIEANHALLEEIRDINQRLIDTVVNISDEDVDPTAPATAAEAGDGTIVKCSFTAVALGPTLKSQYASEQMSPIQPLRVLVPANYPNCSPILLDKFPVEISKEYEDLSIRAKSRFSISLRSLSQPISLGEIARAWDICARAVISEYAQQSGGGSFSSKYGTWENCLSAA